MVQSSLAAPAPTMPMAQMSTPGMHPGMVSMPQSLTAGMPDPDAVKKQKEDYLKMLDDQLKQGVASLEHQLKYQRDSQHMQAEQQKKQLVMQIDRDLKTKELELSQQFNQQMMNLQQQASQQKAALEQQAMQLIMEYQQKKSEEELMEQQYKLQKEQFDMQVRNQQEMAKLCQNDPGAVPMMTQVPQSVQAVPPLMPSYTPPPAMTPGTMAHGSYYGA
jgi:hypothetical protein